MPSRSQAARASSVSSTEQQLRWCRGASGSSSVHSRMVTPTTSYPCSRSRAAATEESTPPDIATTTRELGIRLPSLKPVLHWQAGDLLEMADVPRDDGQIAV